MNRKKRFYKKLLDYTLISIALQFVVLIILLIYAMAVQAFDFDNSIGSLTRPGYEILTAFLVFLGITFIGASIAARYLFYKLNSTGKLESIEEYQKTREYTAKAKTKQVDFSKTEAYKKIEKNREKKESQSKN